MLDAGDATGGARAVGPKCHASEAESAKAVNTMQDFQCSGPDGLRSAKPCLQKGGKRQRIGDAQTQCGANVPTLCGNTDARCGKQPFVETVLPGSGNSIGSKRSFLSATGDTMVDKHPLNVSLAKRHMPIIDGDDECQAAGIGAVRVGELATALRARCGQGHKRR